MQYFILHIVAKLVLTDEKMTMRNESKATWMAQHDKPPPPALHECLSTSTSTQNFYLLAQFWRYGAGTEIWVWGPHVQDSQIMNFMFYTHADYWSIC